MGNSLTRRRRRVGRQALVGTLIDAIYEYEYRTYHMMPTQISIVLHIETS